jgi:predicted phosphodiesterase
MKYNRYENESDEELIFRVCQDKDLIGTWGQVADILNDLLGAEYTESKYRKQYTAFTKMFKANENKFISDDNYIKQLREQEQELKKERQKLSDERIEFNKQIREQARRESFEDVIKRVVCENVEPIEINTNPIRANYVTDNDVVAHITDIHTGIEIDNFKNTFNEDVLKDRIERYIDEIINIKKAHNSENCYLVVSEVISGIIHNTLRIQNNMDLMEQFKFISELLSAMFIKLSKEFNNVYIYTVMGNHSRISPKKEDSLQGENMDILLPFYLKARLQNVNNIHIVENTICQDIAMFNVRGNNIFASHGDKDTPKNVVQRWTMMSGIKPNLCLLGHRHTNSITTEYDTKIVQSGCICGTDDYAMSIRRTNRPEQWVLIVDNNGLKCAYDVQLD